MKPALLLVDLQNDYLATPDLQPPAVDLIPQAAALLAQCRQSEIPVIHIWTTVHRDDDRRLPHWRSGKSLAMRSRNKWPCHAGFSAAEDRRGGDSQIRIQRLRRWHTGRRFETLGLRTVILAGMHLHTCVRIAAMECMERGYHVRIAEEAVASNDPIHAASTRRWLEARVGQALPPANQRHATEQAIRNQPTKFWQNWRRKPGNNGHSRLALGNFEPSRRSLESAAPAASPPNGRRDRQTDHARHGRSSPRRSKYP